MPGTPTPPPGGGCPAMATAPGPVRGRPRGGLTPGQGHAVRLPSPEGGAKGLPPANSTAPPPVSLHLRSSPAGERAVRKRMEAVTHCLLTYAGHPLPSRWKGSLPPAAGSSRHSAPHTGRETDAPAPPHAKSIESAPEDRVQAGPVLRGPLSPLLPAGDLGEVVLSPRAGEGNRLALRRPA